MLLELHVLPSLLPKRTQTATGARTRRILCATHRMSARRRRRYMRRHHHDGRGRITSYPTLLALEAPNSATGGDRTRAYLMQRTLIGSGHGHRAEVTGVVQNQTARAALRAVGRHLRLVNTTKAGGDGMRRRARRVAMAHGTLLGRRGAQAVVAATCRA